MTHPIVATARGWIGTRFHHQGRLRKTESHKGGVDCLGLLAGVAAELDLRGPDGKPLIAADETDYAHQPDTKRLYARLSALLTPIPQGGISPGDILLLSIDESPQHLAIVSDFSATFPLPSGEGGATRCASAPARRERRVREHQHTDKHNMFQCPHPSPLPGGEGTGLGIIHAYAPARAVVEHLLDDWWRQRIEAAFRAIS